MNITRLATRSLLALMIAATATLASCGSSSPTRTQQRATGQARPIITRNMPSVLRNLIGTETTLAGSEPILISGYGLVVDLNGKGSGDVPLAVRATMEQEMSRMGIGSSRTQAGAFRQMSPAELIDDPNTAVVLIRAVVEPGAPVGTRFDVRVDALPGTSTTSLEGGRLYTTRLYKGQVRPGMPSTEHIAVARGPIFSNPFADPTNPSASAGVQTSGRILGGGAVSTPQPLRLILDNPSHSRARAIAAAVNSRFPREPGATFTADGRSDEVVDITVPPSFRHSPADFVQLLLHTRVDQSSPDEWALRYTRALTEDTTLSGELSWALRALGPVAIKHLRPLYNFPEASPRLAALEAGAFLKDPTTRPALEALATSGPPAIRATAMQLLAGLGPDPNVNRFLRAQLNNPEIDLRIAAYEGLVQRADHIVSRTAVDDKFILDTAPSIHPTVYITQLKEPRIVLLGADRPISLPRFVSIWSDSLMLKGESGSQRVSLFYRDDRSGGTHEDSTTADLPSILRLLAHNPTPESPAPGFDMNYSRTVSATYSLLSEGLADVEFIAEADRLALELARSVQAEYAEQRPELTTAAEPDPAQSLWDELETAPSANPADSAPTSLLEPRPKRQFVVPLAPPPARK